MFNTYGGVFIVQHLNTCTTFSVLRSVFSGQMYTMLLLLEKLELLYLTNCRKFSGESDWKELSLSVQHLILR